jgi:hypothetical protein
MEKSERFQVVRVWLSLADGCKPVKIPSETSGARPKKYYLSILAKGKSLTPFRICDKHMLTSQPIAIEVWVDS